MEREYLKRNKETWDNQYQDDLPPFEEIKTYTWTQLILQNAEEIKAKTTLETGAGSGKFTFTLANEGYDATAMDFNESILNSLKRKNTKVKKPIKIVEGNILNIPFEDNSFDLVFSEGVNEHFLGCDREKAMREIVRVSKKRVVIFVPDAQSKNYLEKHPNIPKGEYPFVTTELIDLGKLCGLKNIFIVGLGDQIGLIGDKL